MKQRPGVTVVITTFPERAQLLARALKSVLEQTHPADAIVVVSDTAREGAGPNRTNGLSMVNTEWTAFLDDDDQFGPEHLERLLLKAAETEADMVFPWFSVVGGFDPFPQHFGKEFDLDDPRQTTITMLVRTEAALAVGGFVDEEEDPDGMERDDDGNRAGEDFRFVIRLARAGYTIRHLAERTWIWHHHEANTSGMPSKR
jgi:glycosyltransferase involved in cell wall biosynthesis